MPNRDFRVKNGLHVSANAYIANSITNVTDVQFDVGANTTQAVGKLAWAFGDSTLEVGLNDQVNLQIGQETLIRGTNLTGNTITNGTVVMFSGTQGNGGDINISPAVADGSLPSKYIIGLATQNISNNTTGFVTALGKVRGVNTSSFVVGDELYANPTVIGGLSNTKPIAPNVKVSIGTVLTSHSNNGVILVRPNYGSAIEEDENVFIVNPQEKQVLAWISGNNRFENNTFKLVDLGIVEGFNGQFLKTDGAGNYSFATVPTSNGSGGSGLVASPYVVIGALSTDQTITTATDTLIDFVDYDDVQGWWNPTSKRFTPNVAGYYDVNVAAWFAAGSIANNQVNLQVRKNGNSQGLSQELISTSVGQSLLLNRMIYLNGSSDYLDFTVYSANPTSQVLQKGAADSSGTYFSAALIASGSSTSNTYTTFIGTSGSTTASNTNDALTIVGSNTISTSISGDTLTITMPASVALSNVIGDTGSNLRSSTDTTFSIIGGANTTTSVSGNTVTISSTQAITETLNSVLLRGNTTTQTVSVGNFNAESATFGGNVEIDGNLTVSGTTITVSATSFAVTDNMLYLNQGIAAAITGAVGNGTQVVYTANNNYTANMAVAVFGVNPSAFNITNGVIFAANATTFTVNSTVTASYVANGTARGKTSANPDLGFAAGYNDGTYHHTGLFRDATDGNWKFFEGYLPEPDQSVFIDTSNASFSLANVEARNFVGNVTSIANHSINNLSDIDLVTPQDGDVLTYSGGVWTNALDIGLNSVTARSFAYADLDLTHYVELKAPNVVSTSYSLTLPSADGTNGQALITDGAGQLSFSTISGGGGVTTGKAIAMAMIFG